MLDPISTPEHSKRAIIALLFRLLEIDHKETPMEIGYILHVALQLGISEDEVDEIQSNKHNYPLTPPAEEKDRIIILYYFLFFMNADGVIDPTEEQLVKEFGFRLGFRPALTDDLIQVLKDHANQSVPPERLLEKIRAYLN